ncbi:hypothetical protein KJI44_004509 [Escherichia coli]|nr:hypothetical protein [Escherichia coli]EHP6375997.1 hypothetical protein [Escherichia coli]EKQ8088403.1 hypothetical protein [Escherichia coli]
MSNSARLQLGFSPLSKTIMLAKMRDVEGGRIEAEDINDCYDHWMIWAQIAHADVTNIRIEELKEHKTA